MRKSPLQLDIETYFEEYHAHQSTPAENEIDVTNAAVTKGGNHETQFIKKTTYGHRCQ